MKSTLENAAQADSTVLHSTFSVSQSKRGRWGKGAACMPRTTFLPAEILLKRARKKY